MKKTPKGMRLHIGIYGRRNVGKSSLVNAITRQQVSIVSDVAGTTTDPVEKPMEMLPIGPVLFIDTAGIDDEGDLGKKRIQKSRKAMERTDIAIIVSTADLWEDFEQNLINEFSRLKITVIVVFNKVDILSPRADQLDSISKQGISVVQSIAFKAVGINELRDVLIANVPDYFLKSPSVTANLVPPGEMALLVVPIDYEAPKGRLILPQVQVLRDLLDNDAYSMVVKETGLVQALNNLKKPPALVITDSQSFKEVGRDTPVEIPLTSFSILFARLKGDLKEFVKGALSIGKLIPGDNILIAESCSHHPIKGDIGREKIPLWLDKYVGGKLNYSTVQGHDFPEDLSKYKLVVQCGSCTFNPRLLKTRLNICRSANVPITNYGVAIAFMHGIFERALAPFDEVKGILEENRKEALLAG
ncbi:MAG: [FeFe] hydrogenase H-cluster maturation GTPase HydF [Calditrichaeota bacterium]|nr:MAG: [FeFe] hydrogenase H-cluster maturation GTPase HydF [Calditrichota bacterium]MBL1206235.1 [FeFe] hydrogenase H-cluster maturation GTPase HydF [Calditrichota bacterium]NOG46061.1 [FeFe] hydrogenase H-cluster maturation GTPase HydF [Calditrichota bacterium]